MVLSQEVCSKVPRMAIQLKYFDEKKLKWRLELYFTDEFKNVLTSDFKF